MADKYADKGLVIVAPALDAQDVIQDFQKKTPMKYPVLSEGENALVAFGGDALPALYLVGKDGKIAWAGVSYEDEGFTAELEKALARK